MKQCDINIIFGKRVQFLRNKLGISQEELAYRCNINKTYIGCIERGEKSPTLSTIAKISKGLNIKLQDLFDF